VPAVKRTSLVFALLSLFGCGTRVVDLTGPRDAGPIQNFDSSATGSAKCETVKRGDGTECKLCFAPDGSVLDGACIPTMPTMPTTMSPIDPASATCKVSMMGDARCLLCAAPVGEYSACLKCEPPIKIGVGGEVCRTCLWSDTVDRCLQCFAADGVTTHDDCDTFRKESFPRMIVPPPN
jgi:hypothetical protein